MTKLVAMTVKLTVWCEDEDEDPRDYLQAAVDALDDYHITLDVEGAAIDETWTEPEEESVPSCALCGESIIGDRAEVAGECLGHESTSGPAGISTYCDGTCQPNRIIHAECIGDREVA